MIGQALDDTYEPFSREPEYIELNRLFIKSLHLSPPIDFLDLACGTGTITALLLEEIGLTENGNSSGGLLKPEVRVVCMDISEGQLGLAREYLAEVKRPDDFGQLRSRGSAVDGRSVNFVRASADRLPLTDLSMHAVVMGNAIQLCDDKERVIHEVHRILKKGGIFAFNTSFYAGTYVPGTERFYMRWVEEAISYVKRMDNELRREGLPGITRRKGLARPAFSRPWLSQLEYEQLLDRNSFDIVKVVKRTVLLNQHSFETIGSYAGLASVLLSGYPIQLACQALERSAGPALALVQMDVIPRYWIEVIARRK
jgi:ubiquinone/menaquinone biosynthesis C-methylase UbiE